MNISRGFRRLSILAGMLGLMIMLGLGLGPEGHLNTAPLYIWAWVTTLFCGLPAGLVLLVGWVVAGFRGEVCE